MSYVCTAQSAINRKLDSMKLINGRFWWDMNWCFAGLCVNLRHESTALSVISLMIGLTNSSAIFQRHTMTWPSVSLQISLQFGLSVSTDIKSTLFQAMACHQCWLIQDWLIIRDPMIINFVTQAAVDLTKIQHIYIWFQILHAVWHFTAYLLN